jgi:hypothetical protein
MLGNVNECEHYDDQFKEVVKESLSKYESRSDFTNSIFDTPICVKEIKKQINRLKAKKAPGWDQVSAEHIKFGGDMVAQVITCIFNYIRETCNVPKHFKKGLKLPLFKGGNKDKYNTDDYRGITLLPCLSKLYEMVLLGRADDWFVEKIDSLQGAGKKGMSCIDTSLILKETLSHCAEGGNSVYVVLLDTKKAFDQVWIDGLMYQLLQCGMDWRLWKMIRNFYTDFKCTVRIGNTTSRWFNVTQGVHQGGVLSMKLYCMFANGLIDDLRHSGAGCYIDRTFCGAMMSADDLAILAMFIRSIQHMLNIVFAHSCKWRYQHNVSKCVCVPFGRDKTVLCLKLGDVPIPTAQSAVHLGTNLHKHNSPESRNYTDMRVSRAAKSFYPMLGLTRAGHGPNPILQSKLYWDVSMNSMLFGVEVWDISSKEIQTLEAAHRNMARTIQSLPRNVAHDGVLVPLGWYSIQGIIDQKRLMYLGRILDLGNNFITKYMLLSRLLKLIRSPVDVAQKLIVKSPTTLILESAQRLGLTNYIHLFIEQGGISDTHGWKRIVKQSVKQYEKDYSMVAVSLHPSLQYLVPTVGDFRMNAWWSLGNQYPHLRHKCKVIVRLLMGYVPGIDYKNNRVCFMCSDNEQDSVSHFVGMCGNPRLVELRATLYDNMCHVVSDDSLALDDMIGQCLSGLLLEDSVMKDVAKLVFKMYQERVFIMKLKSRLFKRNPQ